MYPLDGCVPMEDIVVQYVDPIISLKLHFLWYSKPEVVNTSGNENHS